LCIGGGQGIAAIIENVFQYPQAGRERT